MNKILITVIFLFSQQVVLDTVNRKLSMTTATVLTVIHFVIAAQTTMMFVQVHTVKCNNSLQQEEKPCAHVCKQRHVFMFVNTAMCS